MPERFRTEAAEALFEKLKPGWQCTLLFVEDARFADVAPLVEASSGQVAECQARTVDEELLSDLFVIAAFGRLIASYSRLWELIWKGEYAGSWSALQDAIDQLRMVKKFSGVDVSFFEDQLLEVEAAFPYRLFASIGAVVDQFDCSICGLDIDGLACTHRRGELYGGKLAYGIARSITSLDHVSLVTNPEDKRCVMQVADSPQQFPILDYIRAQWHAGAFRVGWLLRLEWSVRRVANPSHVKLRRNDPCYCGKPRKFKNCCINEGSVVRDHVELVGEARDIRAAVV